MSEAARKTMQCFQPAMDITSDEVLAPWGEQPVVDPGPDAPIDVDIPCFDALLEPDAAPEGRLSQQCWNVDCGPDLATVAGPGGVCDCRQQDAGPAENGLQGNCASVYCAEGNSLRMMVGPS